MVRIRFLAALAIIASSMAMPAAAQEAYPSRPITLVVPFGAGGALDLVARVLADGLRNELGQPIVVDNKPGANGLLAMRLVAAAAPDGYTLILSSESNHVILPLVAPKFPLDVYKDFIPISQSGQFQHTLVVKSEMPVKSMGELLAYLKANPGKLSFGSSGAGTAAHIVGEYLSKETRSNMVHVPYRSSPAALNDLLAGNLDLNIQSMPALRSFIGNPRLRVLAVLSAARLKELPDVPTLAESGFAGFDYSSWMGMFGPAALPAPIRDRLSAALVKVEQDPAIQERIRNAGTEPVGSDAATFAAFVASEAKKWKVFVDRTGVRLTE